MKIYQVKDSGSKQKMLICTFVNILLGNYAENASCLYAVLLMLTTI